MTTLQKLEELIYIGFKETDRKWQETDRKLAEANAQFTAWLQQLSQETDRKIGEITGKWSRFVEGLVAPGAVRLFTERGIRVTGVAQRVKRQKNGETMEIDVLATNGEYAVLVEAKSTLGVDDVKEHLARLGKFSQFFPEYKDHKVIGAVAGIVIDEDADKFAYRQGLFVITQSGETVKILNDEKFRPKVWS